MHDPRECGLAAGTFELLPRPGPNCRQSHQGVDHGDQSQRPDDGDRDRFARVFGFRPGHGGGIEAGEGEDQFSGCCQHSGHAEWQERREVRGVEAGEGDHQKQGDQHEFHQHQDGIDARRFFCPGRHHQCHGEHEQGRR